MSIASVSNVTSEPRSVSDGCGAVAVVGDAAGGARSGDALLPIIEVDGGAVGAGDGLGTVAVVGDGAGHPRSGGGAVADVAGVPHFCGVEELVAVDI